MSKFSFQQNPESGPHLLVNEDLSGDDDSVSSIRYRRSRSPSPSSDPIIEKAPRYNTDYDDVKEDDTPPVSPLELFVVDEEVKIEDDDGPTTQDDFTVILSDTEVDEEESELDAPLQIVEEAAELASDAKDVAGVASDAEEVEEDAKDEPIDLDSDGDPIIAIDNDDEAPVQIMKYLNDPATAEKTAWNKTTRIEKILEFLVYGLDFEGYQFTELQLDALVPAFWYRPQIACLSMSGCDIGDEGITLVIKGQLEYHNRFERLNLGNCNFHTTAWKALAELVAESPYLTHLNVGGNQLIYTDPTSEEHGMTFMRNLSENRVLRSLGLAGCGIRDSVAIELARSLEENTRLVDLDLSNNYIGNLGGMALSKALRINRSLLSIDLSNNPLPSEVCHHITTTIHEFNDTLLCPSILERTPGYTDAMRHTIHIMIQRNNDVLTLRTRPRLGLISNRRGRIDLIYQYAEEALAEPELPRTEWLERQRNRMPWLAQYLPERNW